MAKGTIGRRLWKILGGILVLLAVLALAGTFWVRSRLTASLPQLDGELSLAGLAAPVTVTRDGLGIPTVTGKRRPDLARATGFLHAQDRFFQMDLLRRLAAGELSALVGSGALEIDLAHRLHRFRSRAQRALAAGTPEDRELLEAYTAGVNAGLAALGERPFEYLLLRSEPESWRPEDSMLALYSMYLDLQGDQFSRESARGLLHDRLPPALATFLDPPGTSWDAPVEGEASGDPPIPTPVDLRVPPGDIANPRKAIQGTEMPNAPGLAQRQEAETLFSRGSNSWAVAGGRTRHGGALVANDMHLAINVPPIWYRLSLVLDLGEGPRRITGVSLPGTPMIVVGSNGHIAWGFTNSNGDWADLVELEPAPDPEDGHEGPSHYLTPKGPRPFERIQEEITVKDGEAQILEVLETLWGPVIDEDSSGRRRALRWVAHDPRGANLRLVDLEAATSVEEALAVAHAGGIPAQNFVVGDRHGDIAWTIFGPVPRRFGHDGRRPSSWADGSRGWDGWLAPSEVPVLRHPEGGRLWTANAQVVGGEALEHLGDGGYVLGARAAQIRDGLQAREAFGELELLELQLDDRALFLQRWRDLLLRVLTPEVLEGHPERRELRRLAEGWGARAAVDSAGYRLVRAFRSFFEEEVLLALTAPCSEVDPSFDPILLRQTEGALWQLASHRPEHLLPETGKSWNQILLAAADRTLRYFQDLNADLGGTLEDRTWGERNTSSFRHPLSRAVPALSRFLDLAPRPLPGDSFMPRFQSPGAGASQRMVVAPGHEEEGLFHMPGGQSGHPLSPFYRTGFEAWAEGEATAFLPGPAEHTLVLVP